MSPLLSAGALLLVPLVTLAQAPGREAVPSVLDSVTVHGGGARCVRLADLPAASGSYVLEGLPGTLEPDGVRVRCEGAEVVGFELRERWTTDVPEARVQEARAAILGLERELQGLGDERAVLETVEQHLLRLLERQEEAQRDDQREGTVDPEAWGANLAWLAEQLRANRAEARELGWQVEGVEAQLADARGELGRWESAGAVLLFDAHVDTVGTGPGGARLELEYPVSGAGWAPKYDLRADAELAAVELVYRADVWQRTGEDWDGVDVWLSTARPRAGARGPEPVPLWLSLFVPMPAAGVAMRAPARRAIELEDLPAADSADFFHAEASSAQPVFASVSDEGLSVRYHLPRRETIESRDEPTTVLVGRASLDIKPEHHCVPALDTTVWLRGETVNTSDWVMLPGEAAVYFGGDFVGRATLDGVQPGEEFTLHLGPDPGVAVERIETEKERSTGGVFSKHVTEREGWRIAVTNHRGVSADPRGQIHLVVREVLPRSSDEDIDVNLDEVSPALSKAERWKADREEKGILTWELDLARGAKTDLELVTEVEYPASETLVRTPGS